MSRNTNFDEPESTNKRSDILHRFLFEHTRIRGEIVKLQNSWQRILQLHNYPTPLQELLGQAIAATALLGTTLKYKGSLILQIQSDGPVRLVVAEFTSENGYRGMVDWKGDIKDTDLEKLCQNGRLAITIDPKNGKERYQSIVEVKESNLADTIKSYFNNSEQINTQIWLRGNGSNVAGLLLQEMPSTDNEENLHDTDTWNRIIRIAATIKSEELLNLPANEILHRLYHQEDVRIFDPQELQFSCSCSRARTEETLFRLGYNDVIDIVAEHGEVLVECHFCRQKYIFDAIDVEQIFSSSDYKRVPENKH